MTPGACWFLSLPGLAEQAVPAIHSARSPPAQPSRSPGASVTRQYLA